MDVESIMGQGMQGINSTDIMNNVNTTVQQTLGKSGINMSNWNVTSGYIPSALCLVILVIVAIKVVNGIVKAVMGLAFGGALLYFVVFRTHASLEILPMLDKVAPELLRFIGNFTSF